MLKSGLVLIGVSDIRFKVKNFNLANMSSLQKQWDTVSEALGSRGWPARGLRFVGCHSDRGQRARAGGLLHPSPRLDERISDSAFDCRRIGERSAAG